MRECADIVNSWSPTRCLESLEAIKQDLDFWESLDGFSVPASCR